MQKLRSLAKEITFSTRTTSKGPINIENLIIPFVDLQIDKDSPERVDRDMPSTYRSKPLYLVEGKTLYSELAVLMYLQQDGWNGVWMDTYHNRGRFKNFWSAMPPAGKGTLDEHADELYEKIVAQNRGRSSGFFDVFAWKNDGSDYAFIECKRKNEPPNGNELRWLEASVDTGLVDREQLHFVTVVGKPYSPNV